MPDIWKGEKLKDILDEFKIITEKRLKPCKYCKVKPLVENKGGIWSFVGCVNPNCKRNPRTLYRIEDEQEVFEKWNGCGGDVNIRE